MIKNLSQLKKAIAEKKAYIILEHFVHSHYTGQTRVANIVQTNGYYSIVPTGDDINYLNFGKGCWNEYGKASDWEFDEDGVITQYHTWTPYNREPERRLIQKIRFIEE